MATTRSGTAPVAPVHVAIIMDGNGRWARLRGLPRTAGHRAGADSVRRVVEAAIERGIGYLTLFGFSSENWKRPADEIADLMALLDRYLRSEIAELHSNNIRVRMIGDRRPFAPETLRMIEEAETLTGDNSRLNLTIALSYGARGDIVSAARQCMRDALDGTLDPEQLDEQAFAARLSTDGLPDPDLVIRSSGEQRLSNFLLWECAYTEFVFSPTLWPDFGKDDLDRAIEDYSRRERRYGASGA